MPQVLLRATYLLRRPGVAAIVLLLAGGGSALVALPLFNVPGYELGLAMGIAVGILGGAVGIASARQERRLIEGRDPRPRNALRSDSAAHSVGRAFAAALLLNAGALVPPCASAVAFALASTRCNPFVHFAFYPLLALPSAVIASGMGVLCGFAARRARWGGLMYALVLLASAGVTLWPVIFGPQVFAYNHFAGYIPGPLYDEALELRAPLAWYRLETLLWSALAWAVASLLLDMKRGTLGAPALRPGPLLLAAIFVAAIAGIESRSGMLGLRTSANGLASQLGGTRQSEHFVLVYGRGKLREELDRVIRDLEFRHQQIRAFLGGAPADRIRVYLYRSADEKQRLVGASSTQFAKPWRLELHLNDSPFPIAGLKHELTHVMAAPYAKSPFRVTARFGIWPNMAIVEGIAVAADNPVDDLSLHQWAAAMRQRKLAPNIRTLFRPDAFYASPAARAYTVAGSFIRYLGETHGPDKLQALYARGDFEGVYQRPLSSLASEWEAFLDKIPLDAAAVSQAFARFRRGSLFSRPCARELVRLQSEATERLRSDPGEALALFRRCEQIQPSEPSFRSGEALALEKLEQNEDAARVLADLAERVKDEPALAAEVAMARADFAWKRGKSEQAADELRNLLALKPGLALDRMARIKLAAIRSPRVGRSLWAYFRDPEELKLFRLKEALDADPKDPYVTYLLGRRLTQLGAADLGLRYLGHSLSGELPDSIRREALRLRIEAAYLGGDCAAVKNDLGQLPDFGESYKASAGEWLERCDFEERAFHGPLVSQEPFR